MFKKSVQQGRRPRGARSVQVSTVRASSNESAAGGLFQHSHRAEVVELVDTHV